MISVCHTGYWRSIRIRVRLCWARQQALTYHHEQRSHRKHSGVGESFQCFIEGEYASIPAEKPEHARTAVTVMMSTACAASEPRSVLNFKARRCSSSRNPKD
eukprot:TRINITY_DN3016_c0_g1_i1.p1 TRINITY_DN3016_c0_g1~~TRINITY_DN3016_c0_g1_i1.p1  ORF type:complete len:102 (-),score=3.35 TRINITY_DN3016_c0_g1_i1:479-784(-)